MGWWIKKYDSEHDDDNKPDGVMIGVSGSTEGIERTIIKVWESLIRKLRRN